MKTVSEQPVRPTSDSVLTVIALAADGSTIAEGSGFVIEDGRICTRLSLLAGAREARVVRPSGEPADVLALLAEDVEDDLCLLAADMPDGELLPLALAAETEEGSRGMAFGGRLSTAVAGTPVRLLPSAELPFLGRVHAVSGDLPATCHGAPVVDGEGAVVAVVGVLAAGDGTVAWATPADRLRTLGADGFTKLSDRDLGAGAPPEERYRAGLAALLANDTAAACDSFRAIVDDDFRDTPAWIALADALLADRRAKEALDAASVAVEAMPENPDALTAQGAAYSLLGKFGEAAGCFQRAARLRPDSARAHNRLGVAYFNRGMFPDAAGSFRDAIRLNPEDAQEHKNLGVAEFAMGRFREAVDAYREAVRIHPRFARAWKNLGMAYFHLADYDRAAEASREAIRIRPDFARAHNNLGVAYQALGRMDDAIDAYGQALRLKPGFAQAAANLAQALVRKGRKDEAVASLRAALDHSPGEAELHATMGLLLKGIGRSKEAAASLLEATRLDPRHASAHFHLGVLHVESGNKAAALETYKTLQGLDPDRANKLFDRVYK